MRINYVLIDYENVQPDGLSVLEDEQSKMVIFVGPNQGKIPVEIADALHRKGKKAKYIKLSSGGRDALDLHIAFYIGRVSRKNPKAAFQIISKDKGFDSLIEHLKTKKISAVRLASIGTTALESTATLTKSSEQFAAKEPTDKVAIIVDNLRNRGTSKPGKIQTLSSTIKSIFRPPLPESQAHELVKELQTRGFVVIQDSKVSYQLPASL